MKRMLLASAAMAILTGAASAEEVKIGISIGFTGPLESLAPAMAAGAELAMKEVSESGKLLDGSTLVPVRADSTCTDAAAATAAVERIVTSDRVKAIMGGMCSGETIATLQNVAMPNGIVMISPSATSPALSTMESNGLFFRTSPSDARQGQVMAEIMEARGIKQVAVTYTNNDYGKGLADSFVAAFKAAGGEVTIVASHEDGKADYSAEVGALASAGGEVLVIAGYIDQGGGGVLRAAIDSGAFDTFEFPDGMVSQTLEDKFGAEITGSFGQNPAAAGEGREKYVALGQQHGFDATSAFSAESYDAVALMALAMEAAKSTDSAQWKTKVMDVANAPGEKIYPGEIAKGIELIKAGQDVDYVGASAVEFVPPGESAGSYREVQFTDGKMEVVGYR
ncbi:branched-chain amino acid ABC transporter substrate-binding protein [Haematobacter massiliensis]|uniref:Branched-chain amino acid ABC transporter substrate-binding protein n=2 Tax=Haematobacter massiliensis TaxID=195105 RepID=A0A086YBZ3_9RHOB|nr:ABC transporter substrate-binding protein [Haematobacter massiliensis]KFI31793.1 branched-chain amino acid ABC transporter substrate-binding protein [Haematobacter massiliensis]OWJ72178.1 branched-chain amino acid ABC transporter substrate-binding protein [Haematobacter massiliensis]OWJ87748.1 branched-chain amino acid ABC transporter substrate-binding protein [Haematobacter massiliensis]QBJ24185.1 branched-chain amino acid ABC transporter substrate-binding protein [Haematobacter massiliensi